MNTFSVVLNRYSGVLTIANMVVYWLIIQLAQVEICRACSPYQIYKEHDLKGNNGLGVSRRQGTDALRGLSYALAAHDVRAFDKISWRVETLQITT